MDTTGGSADSGSPGLTGLDQRLESLIEAASAPVTARSAVDADPEPVAEGAGADVVAELRGLRQAFLSLPPLDLLDERLVAIEVSLDRLTQAVSQVLARRDEAPSHAPLHETGG